MDAFPDPFRSPATCVSGRADTLGFDRRHAGDSGAVLALARCETLPHLCILAILLFLRRARIVIGDALLLHPLRVGTPVVVLCPVSACNVCLAGIRDGVSPFSKPVFDILQSAAYATLPLSAPVVVKRSCTAATAALSGTRRMGRVTPKRI